MGHCQSEPHRHRGVHGVTTGLEDLNPDTCRVRLGAHDHRAPRADRLPRGGLNGRIRE